MFSGARPGDAAACLHRLERTRQVTVQLADVGQSGKAREISGLLDEAIDRIRGVLVPSKLDQGVDDHGAGTR